APDPAHLGLRAAIGAVNAGSAAGLTAAQQQQVSGALGGDRIQFAPGLQGTLLLTQGELDITRSVVIGGPRAAGLTIDGHPQSRVFALLAPPVPGGLSVSLDSLTLTGGQAFNGGGIFNRGGTLRLSNCTLSGNTAVNTGGPVGGYGGGIYNTGTLAVSNSTLY